VVSVAPEPGVTRPERHGGSDMGWVINCDCGTAIRGQTDDEIVENAQDHAKSKHSLTVTREQALALAERE
jgi:predicted small metal-binding protein